jgi:anti-anti-sigma regulatory factor
MTGTIPIDMAIFPASEWTGQTELAELVRGSEQALLARFAPLVRRQSVTLDMSAIERIDAAGIAALISLYTGAREAGHCFTVVNPSPHIAEILALERILVTRNLAVKSQSSPCFYCSAA